MGSSPKPPDDSDDLEQAKRFVEDAKRLAADESGAAFERALGAVLPKGENKQMKEKKPGPSKGPGVS